MSTPAPVPGPACTRCGRDAQFDFDGVWLCLDCYHVAGSTCAGISRAAGESPEDASPAC